MNDEIKKMPSEEGYSFVKSKKRFKADWAGVSPGDGFRNNLDYFTRMAGQRKFYKQVKQDQNKVISALRPEGCIEDHQKVKAQLDPFYTTFPNNVASQAAVGQTVYLQYERMAKSNLFLKHMNQYLRNPAGVDQVECDPLAYNNAVFASASLIQTRLYLEEIKKSLDLPSVEMYRVYSASQQDTRFPSLNSILRAVIVFGDLLPAAGNFSLHPLTRSILGDLMNLSRARYLELFRYKQYEGGNVFLLIKLGQMWLREMAKCLSRYLPERKKAENQSSNNVTLPGFQRRAAEPDRLSMPPDAQEKPPEKIRPLNSPKPPSLNDSNSPANNVVRNREGAQNDFRMDNRKPKVDSTMDETLRALNNAAFQASRSQKDYEDIRSDLMESSTKVRPFKLSQIEGTPSEGHEIVINLSNNKQIAGEIFDRPLELSDDFQKQEKLMQESSSLIGSLRRSIYPNVKEIPHPLILRTSGSLDPNRLPLAEFNSAVFRRYDVVRKQDKGGKPVLVIACDGSGSLDINQMRMLKVLANSWAHSTAGTSIKTLAALYHSGEIRKGVSGPMVQWIHHPDKTRGTSAHDVTRALVSLPDAGTGIQSDALSISFILDEARKLAKESCIYLVLITDCCWNFSYRSQMKGYDEVRSYFEDQYKLENSKLHTTLVALGVDGKTKFEDLLDKVIPVSKDNLKNVPAVAEKIALYVASCMRERQKLINKAV